jgi:homoserine O-succinyltransferase/O-acetyltransferase
MPVVLDTNELNQAETGELTIGLVNNMPDAALEATERQFTSLLDEASGTMTVRLKLFALPEVPRTDAGWQRLNLLYFDATELKGNRLDGLIVTGAEPLASDLRNEPYWEDLIQLLNWAEDNAVPAIWSCLAAHAAILKLSGIKRRRFREKCTGLFSCSKAESHRLTNGIAARFVVPHSRYNTLMEDEIVAAGYSVLSRSPEFGIDMFVKDGSTPFLFIQGHPEYSAHTLLREYRRDVRRYLTREVETYPLMPQGYFDKHWEAEFRRFREQAIYHRSEATLARLWPEGIENSLSNSWRPAAVQLYANWLSLLVGHKQLAATEMTFPLNQDHHDSRPTLQP